MKWVYRRERERRKKEERKLMPDWIKVQMKVGYCWSCGVVWLCKIVYTIEQDWWHVKKYKVLLEIFNWNIFSLASSFERLILWSRQLFLQPLKYTTYLPLPKRQLVTGFSTDFRLTHRNHHLLKMFSRKSKNTYSHYAWIRR